MTRDGIVSALDGETYGDVVVCGACVRDDHVRCELSRARRCDCACQENDD